MIERLKKRAEQLKTDTFALYLAYKDERTPWHAKLFAGLIAAYAFSPIDLVPDFIPVLGYLDDLILVPLGIALAVKMIPDEVMLDCMQEAKERYKRDGPVNWWAGAAIILIWIACIYFFFRWVLQRI